MRWRSLRRSSNVDDRRRRVGLPRGAGIGGGAAVIILLIVLLLGGDPSTLLNLSEGAGGAGTTTASPADDEESAFASAVLASTEDVWSAVFAEAGARYRPPVLVLYTDAVQSACGFGSATSGPFYCPGDAKVYLDLGFFRELARLGAPGDFAAAYVIGHEVGHHVQLLMGTSDRVRSLQDRGSAAEANALSVRLELQADCYAGVWAHHAGREQAILEPGDVEEGLAAAAAIGDDRLQRQAGGRIQPEAFTHGTSLQRAQWLRAGIEHGSLDACNTFR